MRLITKDEKCIISAIIFPRISSYNYNLCQLDVGLKQDLSIQSFIDYIFDTIHINYCKLRRGE